MASTARVGGPGNEVRGLLRRLLEPAGLADPYAIYAELREREVSGKGLRRVVVGHAQAAAALTSRALSAERIDSLVGRLDPGVRREIEPATRTLKAIVTFRDPPGHTRIRRLLNQALKARTVRRQASVIAEAASGLLDDLRDTTTADLHAALAYPLPAMIVAGILGVPADDRHAFQRWANDVVLFVGSGALDERIARRTLASVTQMRAYMRELVAARRDRPAGDLLSAMVHAADGMGMSEEEIHANALFLMTKQATPLLRYRTRDLTRLLPGDCPRGSAYPRIGRITGRTDDAIKVRGVMVLPAQVDLALAELGGQTTGEFQLHVTRDGSGRDELTLKVESDGPPTLAGGIAARLRTVTGLRFTVDLTGVGTLPRSERKTRRVFDHRDGTT